MLKPVGQEAFSCADIEDPKNVCELNEPSNGFGQGCVTANYSGFAIWFRLYGTFTFTAGGTSGCVGVPYTLTVDGNWNRCGPNGLGSNTEIRTGNGCKRTVGIRGGTRRLKTFSVSASATYQCEDNTISTGIATLQ